MSLKYPMHILENFEKFWSENYKCHLYDYSWSVLVLEMFIISCPTNFRGEVRRLLLNLGLVCCSPAFEKHTSCKNPKQLKQNQNALSEQSFRPFAFSQNVCLLNAGMEHCRCNLV